MRENIISVQDLSFKYPGAKEYVLNNVSLDINKGDFIGLIGSNGSGKTTLCKSLNGLIPHYYVGDYEGQVIVKEQEVFNASVASLAQVVGYVYQDFENQLVRPTVYDEVTFSPLNFGYEDYKERGQKALEILGLESIAEKFIWELSGGQKHLVALAGVLALDPEVIVIDEPVAQLDPVNAKKIYDKLEMLNQQEGKTIISIEHHTKFIANYCNRVVMMDQGEVAWQKKVKPALSQVEDLKEKKIFPPQVTQLIYNLASNQQLYPITIEEASVYFNKHYNFDYLESFTQVKKTTKNNNQTVVEFNDVTHSYQTLSNQSQTALNNVNLSFYSGDRVALVGSNGAGKSTLLKMITGISKPKQGEVIVENQNTHCISSEELAEEVTYIYQDPEEMFINDNIRQDIEYYLKARNVPDYQNFIEKIISTFELQDLQNRDGRLLSGGQQRRASLAIGMAMRPSVILLDEPTSSLDIASRKEMFTMIEKLEKWVKTVIVATHDMQLVSSWADRIIVLNEGQVIKDTDQEGLFNDKELLNKANLQPPQIVELSRRLNMSPITLNVEEFARRLRGKQDEAI
ncbi:energy-coupling factor transporter ATPase [Halanaerocella petrolearia]